MNTAIRVAIVMATSGIFSGLLAAVVVSAFGWPLSIAAIVAGAGAGASGVLVFQRMRGGKAA